MLIVTLAYRWKPIIPHQKKSARKCPVVWCGVSLCCKWGQLCIWFLDTRESPELPSQFTLLNRAHTFGSHKGPFWVQWALPATHWLCIWYKNGLQVKIRWLIFPDRGCIIHGEQHIYLCLACRNLNLCCSSGEASGRCPVSSWELENTSRPRSERKESTGNWTVSLKEVKASLLWLDLQTENGVLSLW